MSELALIFGYFFDEVGVVGCKPTITLEGGVKKYALPESDEKKNSQKTGGFWEFAFGD